MTEEKNAPATDIKEENNLNNDVESQKDKVADDYYSVDDPRKEVNTTIGDGEMRNEGLAGVDDVDADTFSGGSTNEQDNAEFHDSE